MKTWQTLNTATKKKDVIDILLENRGLKTKKEKDSFFDPVSPMDIKLKDLEISSLEIKKAIKRIKAAKEKKEKVIVHGDYDADGVTSTAIMWEALYKYGVDVLPYIPDRFLEGYGIRAESVKKLKEESPELKLIITVDNGIVANKEIKEINKLGIDVIVTDHHQPSKAKPKAYAIIHTTQIAGSGVAWVFARELTGKNIGLELTAIGTIADQMPLIFSNRSFVKYGLKELQKTKRAGLIEMIKEAGIKFEDIGTYEVNYVIAPRINSMGRLKNGIDSLRLLCTKDIKRAKELSNLLSKTNVERQKMVDNTLITVRSKAKEFSDGLIFISDETYHEGVIGLAAGRLVEEFYRPAIVVSKGKEFSKGSARSISGFNIIEVIREHSHLLVAHGGHVMAAGFTIETAKLDEFRDLLRESAAKLLDEEILKRKLKIDCELDFKQINWELVGKLKKFEPTGLGNPAPTFVTKNVEVIDKRLLGKEKKHLKLKLKSENKFIDAIGFGMGEGYKEIKEKIDIVYGVEENIWNGTRSLQLRLRDIRNT
ncbi:MAG TPA: single-stranded-DNA-specific exonuclease RecJ [Candidatus Saccharimonadales bacterium]|nr:single-stranded-DNA-specific exonuclease RecJ [Candidatus Saccharimonadales bacterium]